MPNKHLSNRFRQSRNKKSKQKTYRIFSDLGLKSMQNPDAVSKEIRRELAAASCIKSLNQTLLKILSHLGRSEYSLIRLDNVHNAAGQPVMSPKTLLCNHREQPHTSNVLSQAQVSSIRNRHLSMLYHFVACAPFDSYLLSKRRLQYILITSTGYYDYNITPSHSLLSESQYACAKDQTIQHKTIHKDGATHALQLLTDATCYIGTRKFPELFLCNNTRKRTTINPQPQKVLNILALQDATLNQVAQQLHVTVNTVNKHMASAKIALGTNTIAGTICKAIHEGLIDH